MHSTSSSNGVHVYIYIEGLPTAFLRTVLYYALPTTLVDVHTYVYTCHYNIHKHQSP